MPTKPESSTVVALSQEELHAYIDDRMRTVVRILFEQVLEEELTAMLQAVPYERNGMRLGQRNGSYRRDLVTKFGRIVELRVPRERAGRFRTKLFDRYKRRVKEIDTAIRDMFINGISTGKVGTITELLLETAPSASSVSRVFHTLEAECDAWRERRLDTDYLYIFLDGTNFTIGCDDEFGKHPLLAALGVKANGERELLGYAPGNRESRAAWESFLESLKRRGVERADLWITDGGQAVNRGRRGEIPWHNPAALRASELISKRIKELGDWRGKTLEEVRRIIKEADPDIVEEWKWRKGSSPGIPVWSRSGGICTGEIYKNKVKLTFFRGAALEDPSGLFNASLGGKVRRAIDIHEGDKIDESALKALIREAVALNLKRKK